MKSLCLSKTNGCHRLSTDVGRSLKRATSWLLPPPPLLLLLLQDLPGVEVTLVHGGQRLLPSLTAKASAAAEAWLRSKGCKVGSR
jgi:hypothetical protein